ncbi:hypothetical protein HZU77_003055 [Neisseriaceae bacterium TC5R-5]|nr:hypothetical protein [Neisseriaceae bacterium TC5R-5]
MQDVIQTINSTDKLFHDGNPASGEPGTIVNATWLNGVQGATTATQQELISLIKDSGQTVDPKRTDQVLQAVRKVAWNGTARPTTLAGYGITDAMKTSDWGVQGYTQLDVGSGKPFATIQDAWDSLNGKTLQADVLIKVADGEYKTTGLTLTHQPFAHRIRIEGNIANPTACKIRFIADVNKQSHGVIFSNVRGVAFSGFHLIGEGTATNWTHRCLLVQDSSQVVSAANALIVEGGVNSVYVNNNSFFVSTGLKVSKAKNWGVVIGNGSAAELASLSAVGDGKTTSTVIPAHINQNTPTILPNGLLCQDGSRAWLADAKVSGVAYGIYAACNGYIWCDGASVDQANNGFVAYEGGRLRNTGSGVTKFLPAGLRGKATNCDIGFNTNWGGVMMVPMAIAENCRIGFYCSVNSCMHADSGWAKNCTTGYLADALGVISAWSTKAASTGNTTPYSPVTIGTGANGGAYLSYS